MSCEPYWTHSAASVMRNWIPGGTLFGHLQEILHVAQVRCQPAQLQRHSPQLVLGFCQRFPSPALNPVAGSSVMSCWNARDFPSFLSERNAGKRRR
jgi:hypothetical protein